MTYPYKIEKFLKEDSFFAEGKGFIETEDGNFFGIGYASPHTFVAEVNSYLGQVDPKRPIEDLFLTEDARKVWGQSLDVPGGLDEIHIVTDGVTERSPFAFQLYILVV